MLAWMSYHARDKCQGACVIPNGHKLVTSGQIPSEADVSCDIFSSIDRVVGLAHAVDGGLKLIIGKQYIYIDINSSTEVYYADLKFVSRMSW